MVTWPIGTHLEFDGVKICPLSQLPSDALWSLHTKYKATSRIAYFPSARLAHGLSSFTGSCSINFDCFAKREKSDSLNPFKQYHIVHGSNLD